MALSGDVVGFEVAAFPFCARKFAAIVGSELGSEPPAARDLPGGKFLRKEVSEIGDGHASFRVERGDNGVDAVDAFLNSEDDAFDDRRVSAKN